MARWIYAEISKTALTFPVFYGILLNMKAKEQQDVRPRSEIIGEIAAIPSAVQGKICEMRKQLSGGKVATYYNLQYWADGRNHTIHIPREKLAQFRDAVSGGERLKRLVTELAEADARGILSSAPPLKKSSPKSRSRARPR
ncbi:MAG: hypothetical protein J6336_06705 [Kiritimatiellae bacterium]|nr:hypothetical protein [Kiritimatiellia bacterium]